MTSTSHFLGANLSETCEFWDDTHVYLLPEAFRSVSGQLRPHRDTLASPLDVISRARPTKPDQTLMAQGSGVQRSDFSVKKGLM
jgi:hypothetical protein